MDISITLAAWAVVLVALLPAWLVADEEGDGE